MTETATLAGGCFWGVEELIRKLPGVIDTTVGYAGGSLANPRYEDVKGGRTGHAESLQILFDPQKISYDDILDYFFRLHDPTTVNQQGNDRGTQYRSIIFYADEKQREYSGTRKAAGAGKVAPSDRHGDCSGGEVLAGRGVSPGLSATDSVGIHLPLLALECGGHAVAFALEWRRPCRRSSLWSAAAMPPLFANREWQSGGMATALQITASLPPRFRWRACRRSAETRRRPRSSTKTGPAT